MYVSPLLLFAEDEINDIMKDFDADGNGEISYHEFVTLVNKLGKREDTEDVRNAFAMFDTDGDGSITPIEFKKTMRRLGLRLTDGQIYAMVEEADVNGDGEIDYKEFMALVADTKLLGSSSPSSTTPKDSPMKKHAPETPKKTKKVVKVDNKGFAAPTSTSRRRSMVSQASMESSKPLLTPGTTRKLQTRTPNVTRKNAPDSTQRRQSLLS